MVIPEATSRLMLRTNHMQPGGFTCTKEVGKSTARAACQHSLLPRRVEISRRMDHGSDRSEPLPPSEGVKEPNLDGTRLTLHMIRALSPPPLASLHACTVAVAPSCHVTMPNSDRPRNLSLPSEKS